MNKPHISEARAICERTKARAVIVICIDEDSYALASYGQTKLECSQTAATADAIGNALTRGTLPIWGSEVKP